MLGPRANALDKERRELEGDIAATPANVLTLHPATIAAYERKLKHLQETIATDIAGGATKYNEALRDLVDHITVRRPAAAPDAVEIEITGRLNALLGPDAFPNGAGRISGSGRGI